MRRKRSRVLWLRFATRRIWLRTERSLAAAVFFLASRRSRWRSCLKNRRCSRLACLVRSDTRSFFWFLRSLRRTRRSLLFSLWRRISLVIRRVASWKRRLPRRSWLRSRRCRIFNRILRMRRPMRRALRLADRRPALMLPLTRRVSRRVAWRWPRASRRSCFLMARERRRAIPRARRPWCLTVCLFFFHDLRTAFIALRPARRTTLRSRRPAVRAVARVLRAVVRALSRVRWPCLRVVLAARWAARSAEAATTLACEISLRAFEVPFFVTAGFLPVPAPMGRALIGPLHP
mmetsp:Transcript_1221/g.3373  ORF Transcript_1221/g.3373 Transcript_1221/m.3373 type:complete len:290 (+) Transcript_1221:1030-1899(+)